MAKRAGQLPEFQDSMLDEEARLVLRRCALFYRAAGFSANTLLEEWSQALRWASRQKVKAKIYRAGPVGKYRSICERWIRNPDYLNSAGNPIPLPATGPKSIATIMKDLGLRGDARVLASALEKIGSVRKVNKGKYLLIEKMFRTRPSSSVAYETFSQFLAHAVKAATMPLHNSKSDKHSHWLTATRSGLSEQQIRTFVRFVKRRSQPQMLEIDDALNSIAESGRPPKRRLNNTVGAGIFTFVTDSGSP